MVGSQWGKRVGDSFLFISLFWKSLLKIVPTTFCMLFVYWFTMARRQLPEQALMENTGLVEYSLYFNLICPWPIQAGRLFHHFIYWDLGQQIYWECSKWTTDLLISTGSRTFMSNWDKYYKKNEIIILKISIDQKLSIFQKLRKK